MFTLNDEQVSPADVMERETGAERSVQVLCDDTLLFVELMGVVPQGTLERHTFSRE